MTNTLQQWWLSPSDRFIFLKSNLQQIYHQMRYLWTFAYRSQRRGRVAGQVGLLGRTLLSEDKKDPRSQGSEEGLKAFSYSNKMVVYRVLAE